MASQLYGLVDQLANLEGSLVNMFLESSLRLSHLINADFFILVDTPSGRRVAGSDHLCSQFALGNLVGAFTDVRTRLLGDSVPITEDPLQPEVADAPAATTIPARSGQQQQQQLHQRLRIDGCVSLAAESRLSQSRSLRDEDVVAVIPDSPDYPDAPSRLYKTDSASIHAADGYFSLSPFGVGGGGGGGGGGGSLAQKRHHLTEQTPDENWKRFKRNEFANDEPLHHRLHREADDVNAMIKTEKNANANDVDDDVEVLPSMSKAINLFVDDFPHHPEAPPRDDFDFSVIRNYLDENAKVACISERLSSENGIEVTKQSDDMRLMGSIMYDLGKLLSQHVRIPDKSHPETKNTFTKSYDVVWKGIPGLESFSRRFNNSLGENFRGLSLKAYLRCQFYSSFKNSLDRFQRKLSSDLDKSVA